MKVFTIRVKLLYTVDVTLVWQTFSYNCCMIDFILIGARKMLTLTDP